MAKSGDEIKVKVYFKNKGTSSHRFYLGCTMRHKSSGHDYDLPMKSNWESAGGTGNETFKWDIPSGALTGSYNVITAVWEGKTGTTPFNRLDTKTNSSAFSIE